MATVTTNYGFDIPQSSDLVKDGATAIALLGQDIDTAMNTALGTKKAGMVLLNTTSFSAVSSLTLPANLFTSTYDHYKFVLTAFLASGSNNINMRVVAAGTPNSSANYAYNLLFMTPGSATVNGGNNTGNTLLPLTNAGTTDTMAMEFNLYGPKLVRYTAYSGMSARGDQGMLSFAGAMTVDTSYDSIQFIPSASTMTGKVAVYGFNV
jgi:hypothetical protein